MKKILLAVLLAVCGVTSVSAASTFQRKANALTPKNAGTVYDMGSKGFVVVEGKRALSVGERSKPKLTLFAPRPLFPKGADAKSLAQGGGSFVFEIDLVKYEF